CTSSATGCTSSSTAGSPGCCRRRTRHRSSSCAGSPASQSRAATTSPRKSRRPSSIQRSEQALIRIAELLDPNVPAELWPLLKQVGVDDVVSLLDDAEQAFRWLRSESHLDVRPESLSLPEEGRSWSRPALERPTARYEQAGFRLVAIEDTPPMDDIRLGRPGREEQLDLFCEQLRAMGEIGVPVLCYNWVAVYSWARTGLAVPARGGALVTEYDHAEMSKAPARPEADLATEERLWGDFRYFLRRVVPVAGG